MAWPISVPYSALTDCFQEIDKTTKRNIISSLLTKFLLKVAMNPGKDGGDLLRVVYLCINRVSRLGSYMCSKQLCMILTHLAAAQLCPDYMGVELGIGESLIVKAIAQCTGRSAQQIKQDLVKVGDLGLVAEVCLSFSSQPNQSLISAFYVSSNQEESRRRYSRQLH